MRSLTAPQVSVSARTHVAQYVVCGQESISASAGGVWAKLRGLRPPRPGLGGLEAGHRAGPFWWVAANGPSQIHARATRQGTTRMPTCLAAACARAQPSIRCGRCWQTPPCVNNPSSQRDDGAFGELLDPACASSKSLLNGRGLARCETTILKEQRNRDRE